MIELAFDIQSFQVSIGPGWINVDRRWVCCEVEVSDQVDIAPSDGRGAFEYSNGFEVDECPVIELFADDLRAQPARQDVILFTNLLAHHWNAPDFANKVNHLLRPGKTFR